MRVLQKACPIVCKNRYPLSNLTKAQVKFHWTGEFQQAFERLKSSLISPPILVKARLDQPFIVTTDASNSHVGGVLNQIQDDNTNKPIGYFSKKLSPCETRYSVTDKEALAVILTYRHFIITYGERSSLSLLTISPSLAFSKRKPNLPG